MNVRIIATHNCSHYRTLEHELKDLAIVHELLFVEDHPEIVQRYNIRLSTVNNLDGICCVFDQAA